MNFRAAHPEHKGKWLDVKFTDLINDPIAVANNVITHSGSQGTDATTGLMQKYVADSLAKRGDAKLHTYSLADYGVAESAFESGVFAKYKKEHIA